MNKNEFVKYVNQLGIDIDEEKLSKLEKYYEMLVEKNKVMNLTNIVLKDDVYLKHFYDSLTLVMAIDFANQKTLCDVGTGAGFPGMVLKILYPHLKVVLVDSLGKRITFLNEVICALGLKDIEAIHIRAEDYVKNNRDVFDIVTSRAVAKLSILTELCLPLVSVNGCFIGSLSNSVDE